MKFHGIKDLFDFLQAFATEVFGLQHFLLSAADQLTDSPDVGVFQAVVAARYYWKGLRVDVVIWYSESTPV